MQPHIFLYIKVAVIIIIFLIGAYITYTHDSASMKAKEGFTDTIESSISSATSSIQGSVDTSRCPNILIQEGSDIYLYNSKVAKVPGVNPIRFNNLEEYTEFMEWLRNRGIRCPALFLQKSYDTQGNEVYKMRPSPEDPQGGLSPHLPYTTASTQLVKNMDASRENAPFNQNNYPGFDPMNLHLGEYTEQDALFHQKELKGGLSDNPMDTNWGGVKFSQASVASGAYADRTRTLDS